MHDSAIGDHPAADTCRYGDEHQRGCAAASAETPFAESGGVGIILQPRRQVQPVLKKARKGDFTPAR